jgi:hypothetical protein
MPTEIRARVEDEYGNGVYGDTVRFSIVSGDGYFERPFLVTDSLGYTATTRWIPGAPGAAMVRATASGFEAIFNASVQSSTSPSLLIENQPLGRAAPLGAGSQGAVTDPVTVRLIDASGAPIAGAIITWSGWGAPVTTSTNSEGRSSSPVRYYNDSPGVQTATITAEGATATLYIVVQPSGANVNAYPSPGPGVLAARVGTRVEDPVIVACQDRQGGPSNSCGAARVSGFGGEGFGGTIIPAPGYRLEGRTAYYWILPSTPGTYYFWAGAPANYTDARATP